MKPIYITVGNEFPLMIIPDSEAHLDGHVILTHTYSIYRNRRKNNKDLYRKETELHLTKHTDPDYMGFITFELPGLRFNYTDDGNGKLTKDEVEEIAELIVHYRKNPKLWSV